MVSYIIMFIYPKVFHNLLGGNIGNFYFLTMQMHT
jgi:hypothetical protein